MSGTLRRSTTPQHMTAGPSMRMQRGRTGAIYGGIFSRARLPSDSIGNFALQLTNVVVGSAIRVERISDGGEVYSATASASTVNMIIAAYSAGNSNNNLRVKVRKGSASPYFIPYETFVTAIAGSQSIYVSQISDE